MQQINFTTINNNETVHRQLKLLMRNHRLLNIRLDETSNAWISTYGVTGLQYQLKAENWQWLLNYLLTGDYEDFGVFPSQLPKCTNGFLETTVKSLIDNNQNVARIPFLRETQAFVKLRALFKYGKLFFSIRRTDEFMDYLNSKGL